MRPTFKLISGIALLGLFTAAIVAHAGGVKP